jgi:adenylosuccinate synthase
MPVSIVVGGQFGSEGKGKIALEIVRRALGPVTVIRVGGPNSGHTAYDHSGRKWALRQMPAGCIDRNVDVVFPAGSYIDVDLLLDEIKQLDYPRDRVKVSKFARIITLEHRKWEQDAGLVGAIGSTGSGVGGAVLAHVARDAKNLQLSSFDADHATQLHPFVSDVSEILRQKLSRGQRVVIEGTQGFGLSLNEGGYWPKATARSTTAAGALAEAGLSPRDVDDVTMVLRSFPIRVAGDSGPLPNETTWEDVAALTGNNRDLREYTTVTKRLRRVGCFDAELVRRALDVNNPSRVVVNHMDYLGAENDINAPSSAVQRFLSLLKTEVGVLPHWLGFSPSHVAELGHQFA